MKRLGLLALAAPAIAFAAPQAPTLQVPLQQQVEARLGVAGPGPRFGLVVTTLEGQELVALRPDERFIPASNAKVLTTAAALDGLGPFDRPLDAGGARVRIEPAGARLVDVVLEGRGDPHLSSAPDCVTACLAALADSIAARTRRVRHVIGDARFFPDERWSQGMSWNNIPTSSGTALSALTLDNNELVLRVTPAEVGKPPRIGSPAYFLVENAATTVTEGASGLEVERLPGSLQLRLSGTIAAGSGERPIRLGIDDPAHHAAWRLRALLEQRGVRVTGSTLSRYRPDGEAVTETAPSSGPLAEVAPGPLLGTLRTINKSSQNLHSELLLRHLGLKRGPGTAEAGIEQVRSTLERAGVPARAWHLADGSGMSTYNRLTPRAMTTLLGWIARQPWGEAFRSTLPVGGVDGTLARRFRDTPLRGRIFAKTGSLNATNALAGYFLTRSGRTLVFAFYANDVPEEVGATAIMDQVLVEIAERY